MLLVGVYHQKTSEGECAHSSVSEERKWIEECANSYLSRLEYLQVVDIFYSYLLRQNQDLMRNCENVIQA